MDTGASLDDDRGLNRLGAACGLCVALVVSGLVWLGLAKLAETLLGTGAVLTDLAAIALGAAYLVAALIALAAARRRARAHARAKEWTAFDSARDAWQDDARAI